MENFINDIKNRYGITDEGVELLYSELRVKSFDKDEVVVAEGSVNNSIYFIKKGVWRTYAMKDAEEITLWFAVAGDFDLAPWCVMRDMPSRYTIMSSCESEAIQIRKSLITRLSEISPSFVGFIRDLYADIFLHTDDIMVDLASPKASGRYLAFLEKMPELFRDVPQKDIARFLGVAPQSLSRIKANIKH